MGTVGKSIKISLDELTPTQLYISKSKLASVDSSSYTDPVPVRCLGPYTFLTDGHTRAVRAFLDGRKEIDVVYDPDRLDWFQYAVCMGWCFKEGSESIRTLSEHILDHGNYQVKWLERCRAMQESVKKDPGSFIEIKIKQDLDSVRKRAEAVLRSLPDWFGIEEAIVEYVKGLEDTVNMEASINGINAGFMALKLHHGIQAEIYVTGVYEMFHRRGIGTMLTEHAEKFSRESGLRFMTVKTLSPLRENEPYRRTREFYEKNGFLPFEEFPDLWGEVNPCRLYIKQL